MKDNVCLFLSAMQSGSPRIVLYIAKSQMSSKKKQVEKVDAEKGM